MRPARYKSARGGRGSSKSHTFAQLAVLRMAGLLPAYEPDPVRIASARQFQSSIGESVKVTVEDYIRLYGLQSEFKVGKFYIDHRRTHAHMFFPGWNRNPNSLRSVEGVDVMWFEEAHTIGEEMTIIAPSVRKAGSELWFSWNPENRADWAWKRFVIYPRAADVSALVNFTDNPWWPFLTGLQEEMADDLANNPDIVPWKWYGQPNDGDADAKILPYGVLLKCVEAFKLGLAPRYEDAPLTDVGFDIAFGGLDKCATVVRTGPTIRRLDVWPGVAGYLTPAVGRAHETAAEADAYRVYYDATGGDTVLGEFTRYEPGYSVRGIGFGDAVAGPEKRYETRRPNQVVFARRNIQMGYAVRLRAFRTVRLLAGDRGIDPAQCLFIDPSIPRLEEYLAELSQPIKRRNPTTGKIEVDKRVSRDPNNKEEKSPDMYDATILAFARDSETGLRARV